MTSSKISDIPEELMQVLRRYVLREDRELPPPRVTELNLKVSVAKHRTHLLECAGMLEQDLKTGGYVLTPRGRACVVEADTEPVAK
jgi:hypothetical protein